MKPKVAICSCYLQHGPFLGLQLPRLQLLPMTHPLPRASVTLSAAVTFAIFPPSASVTPSAAVTYDIFPLLGFSFHPKGCFLVLFHLSSCPLTLGSLVPCHNSLQSFSRTVVYFISCFLPVEPMKPVFRSCPSNVHTDSILYVRSTGKGHRTQRSKLILCVGQKHHDL